MNGAKFEQWKAKPWRFAPPRNGRYKQSGGGLFWILFFALPLQGDQAGKTPVDR
jgi:hypothetical protein